MKKPVYILRRYLLAFFGGAALAVTGLSIYNNGAFHTDAYRQALAALAKGQTQQVCLFTPYTMAGKVYAMCNLQAPDDNPFNTINRIGSVGEVENALAWCSGNGIEIRFIDRLTDKAFCLTR